MSRTRHITTVQLEVNDGTGQRSLRSLIAEARPRRSAKTRMTHVLNKWNEGYPSIVAAAGNPWEGTIAQVGGSARRRDQRDWRVTKIHGRCKARRAEARDTASRTPREMTCEKYEKALR